MTETKPHIFTYVGDGDTPPGVINFMGLQVFVRGEPTEVTDPIVLAKLNDGHRCFVSGKGDQRTMHSSDRKAAAHAEGTRKRNAGLEAETRRRNR